MKRIYLTVLTGLVLSFTACEFQNSEKGDSANAIYLNYTEAGIDSAYNQSFWAPNVVHVLDQLASLRDLSQRVIGDPERIQYGSTEIEQLDLYRPRSENAPVHIHVHGGAWRGGNGTGLRAYDARKFVERGAMYIAPDYQLATDADGSLHPMVNQLRNAVKWTYENARKYGGDPDRIYLSGHSAGGHLGGVLITSDWTEYDLPDNVIKAAFLASGMYDLYPVSLSYRNEYVSFSEKMIEDLSPVHYIHRINMPVILAYGSQESPEFKRQSEAFAEALEEKLKSVKLHVLQGYNHFEIAIAMGNPYDLPGELMLRQMNLD